MNLSERGATIAAPIIAGNEELRALHAKLMTEGNKVEAAHMINVITAAELLSRDAAPSQETNITKTTNSTTVYAHDEMAY